MMNLKQGEELAAKGATGRRVTLDDLHALVEHVEYWRPTHSQTTTICALTTVNGYTVSGQSGAADPANFDAAKGQKFAFEDALRKLHPLEGYRLALEIHAEYVKNREAGLV